MNLLNNLNVIPGAIIRNRYRIEDILGKGGFGEVHRGWDTVLEIPVAVKMLFDNSPDSVNLFKSEAKILAKLKHPHLPRVTDYFSENGTHFLVMDFIDGEDLQVRLDKTKGFIDHRHVVEWMAQILAALHYIHTMNIVHRDVKPGNIRVTPSGVASLVDFGIAKTDSRKMTSPGAKGAFTPYMASPEQCQTLGQTTPASDIYAVGATMYYLVTGQVPADAVSRLMGNPLIPPESINPSIPLFLSRSIQKAMALSPSARFPNADIMRNEMVQTVVLKNVNMSAKQKTGGNIGNLNVFKRDIRRR